MSRDIHITVRHESGRSRVSEPTAPRWTTGAVLVVRYSKISDNADGSIEASVIESPAGWAFETITVFPSGGVGGSRPPPLGMAWVVASEDGGEWRYFSPNGTTCADYYNIWTGLGEITGSFDWELEDTVTETVIASGTYILGTSDNTNFDSIETAIQTIMGATPFVLIVTGGPLPGNAITIHPNRGLDSTRYVFRKVAASLTPEISGGYAFVAVSACCIVGG